MDTPRVQSQAVRSTPESLETAVTELPPPPIGMFRALNARWSRRYTSEFRVRRWPIWGQVVGQGHPEGEAGVKVLFADGRRSIETPSPSDWKSALPPGCSGGLESDWRGTSCGMSGSFDCQEWRVRAEREGTERVWQESRSPPQRKSNGGERSSEQEPSPKSRLHRQYPIQERSQRKPKGYFVARHLKGIRFSLIQLTQVIVNKRLN